MKIWSRLVFPPDRQVKSSVMMGISEMQNLRDFNQTYTAYRIFKLGKILGLGL